MPGGVRKQKLHQMAKTKVTVAYQVFDRQDRIQSKEKTFSSREAMSSWVEKQEQKDPRWYRILAICEEKEQSR